MKLQSFSPRNGGFGSLSEFLSRFYLARGEKATQSSGLDSEGEDERPGSGVGPLSALKEETDPPPSNDRPSAGSRRRSDRILIPLPIRVTGSDPSGVSFVEETATVCISPRGARISLTHDLLPDEIVLVKNVQNGIEEEFRVVGACQQVFGERRESGLEALSPKSEIWGVKFTVPADEKQPKVLVECAACKEAAHTPLSFIEYEVLLSVGLISRHCDRCGETTRWRPGKQRAVSDEGPTVSRPHESGSAMRKTQRLKLAMHLRIRNDRGVTDFVQTRNVSKAGLCFVSSQPFAVVDEVYITIPFAGSQTSVETKGRVVWCAPALSGRSYGVSFLNPNGHG